MIQLHGGNTGSLPGVIDFSANINPLGMPDGVRDALSGSIDGAEQYPDPYCTELRQRLAEHEKISPDNIVCGNGAADLIYRIVHAFRPQKAVVCAPSFGEYTRALNEAGCSIAEHLLTEENGFVLTDSILDELDGSVDICFLCTPNNPTGLLIEPELLERTARRCEENGILLVCDECFMGFVRDGDKYSLRRFISGNCIILKAFTKLYAMPGLRLGYAVCGSAETSQRIAESGQFWSVSSLAQAAGTAALGEEDYTERTVDFIVAEKDYLISSMRDMGIRVYGSEADFVFFRSLPGLCEKMLSEGILIRDCQSFHGLEDGFYRIAVRGHEDNTRLITALRRCING